MDCRCGWDGVGKHPCHYRNYECKAPATERFYEPREMYSIAGQQDKRSMTSTFACEPCWAAFLADREKHRQERRAVADALRERGYQPK